MRDREHADNDPWIRGYEVELLRGAEEKVQVLLFKLIEIFHPDFVESLLFFAIA